MRRGSRVALVMVGFCQSSSLFPSPVPSPVFRSVSNENPGKHSCYRPNRAIEVELGGGIREFNNSKFCRDPSTGRDRAALQTAHNISISKCDGNLCVYAIYFAKSGYNICVPII